MSGTSVAVTDRDRNATCTTRAGDRRRVVKTSDEAASRLLPPRAERERAAGEADGSDARDDEVS
jgi:hypothetical protein